MFQVAGWPCVESLVFVAAVGGVAALVAAKMLRRKEHLLVSKALPIFFSSCTRATA